MYEILKEAAKGFNIDITGYTKTKAAFLVDTCKGTMTLKKQNADKDKLSAYANVTDSLHEMGFTGVEKYERAGDKPFIAINGGLYTLAKCGDGVSCDFTVLSQSLSIASSLAKMHTLSKNICVNGMFDVKPSENSYFSKRVTEARHIKKWLDKQSSLTDADVVFIKNYNAYVHNAERSARAIMLYLDANKRCLCLNEIKEDNILISNDNVRFINVEKFALSLPAIDLCELIRRYVKRGGDSANINLIIKAYSDERKIDAEELLFIRNYLSYPLKFFSIANKYYNSRRAYNCAQTYTKLRNSAQNQNKISSSLENIEQYTKNAD